MQLVHYLKFGIQSKKRFQNTPDRELKERKRELSLEEVRRKTTNSSVKEIKEYTPVINKKGRKIKHLQHLPHRF